MADLSIEYDPDTDVVEIDGIRYAGALFREFGFAPIGSVLRIEQRSDGVLTVTRLADQERGATI